MLNQLAFSAPIPLVSNAQQVTPFQSAARCVRPPRTSLSLSPPSTPSNKPLRSTSAHENRNTVQRSKRVPTFRKMQQRHRQGPAFHRRRQQEKQLAQVAPPVQPETQPPPTPRTPLVDILVGEKLSGTVRNTVPHGAYIDVGAEKDGLVHVRDMAVDFVHTPTDIVRSGDTVTVWVKYVNATKRVLGLSLVKPHRGFESRMHVNDIIVGARYHGVIERITNYGAYVDIGAERHAFLHVAALWGTDPRETLDYLRLGQKVWVHVVEVDAQRNHIRLWAKGKGNLPLAETTEISPIPVAPEASSDDEPVPTPTLRVWQVNQTEDSAVQEEYEEDEFSFVQDDSEWFDEFVSKKRKAHQTDNLREVAHMFDDATEFISEDVRAS